MADTPGRYAAPIAAAGSGSRVTTQHEEPGDANLTELLFTILISCSTVTIPWSEFLHTMISSASPDV